MRRFLSEEFAKGKEGKSIVIGKEKLYSYENATPPLGKALSIWSHAGGSGKSTLARDLAYEMVRRGFRVLLIDADPQANLTTWVGIDPVSTPKGATLLRLVEENALPEPFRVDFGSGEAVLEIIPANTYLALAEVIVPTKPSGMLLLRGQLRTLRERYDWILMDSPPSLGALAGMIALAGDGLIVPVETSAKGLQALEAALMVSRDYHTTLTSLGFLPPERDFIRLIVPTRYDGRTGWDRMAQKFLSEFESRYPVSSPISYRPAPYKAAVDKRLPVRTLGEKRIQEELDTLTKVFLEREGVSVYLEGEKEVKAWA